MHGNITYMLDCWIDPDVHLFLLKSSMANQVSAILLRLAPSYETVIR